MITAGPSPSCAMTLRRVAGSRSVATTRCTCSPPAASSAPIASSVTLTTGMVDAAGVDQRGPEDLARRRGRGTR